MNFEEFLKPAPTETPQNVASENSEIESVKTPEEEIGVSEEVVSSGTRIDEVKQPVVDPLVQEMLAAQEEGKTGNQEQQLEVSNAVVEELAKDTVEQQETIKVLRKQISDQQSEIAALKLKIEEQNITLGKVGETLAKNSEVPESTKITLLERDAELPDRFEGETRDHVLEALKAARNAAESDGRLRHAQILESVLCANEPNGQLAKKRESLKKLFETNANLVTGPVIEELVKLGISHKNGEEYLLPSEILKRNY